MNDIPKEPSPEAPPPPSEQQAGPAKTVRPEKKVSFWTRLFRWVMLLLIVFGLGALLVTFLFYLPLQRQMSARRADLTRTNQQVADLQATAESFSPLGSQNEDLQTQLNQANATIALLSARSDVLSAELALAKKDAPRARLALSKTKQTLDEVAKLLPDNQKAVVNGLQDRLQNVLKEVDSDPYAAQSDLDVMDNSLLQMHNALVR